ncbi:MAG: Ig-like domain-containing protein [Firmicutes bacterium]|nr:Ig-like domain-containing protein [Candidatus Fiminaster equi]
MKVASNACNLGLSATSTITASSGVSVGDFSSTYTQTQGYKYLKIMSGGSTSQIKTLNITFTKESDQPLPPFEGDYKLVESVSELNTGDKIVLGNVAKETVAGAFGSYQYFTATQGTFGDGELTPTNPDVITLLATDGGWNLYTQDEGYIGCGESGKLSKDKKDTWTISIAEGGAATIDNGTYKIKYNVNSPRFSCYTGEPTESMPLPEIYKAKNGEVDKFTVTYSGNGATGFTTDSNEYNIGSEVTVLANGFDKPVGKVFKEWNTKTDGTGDSYAPDDKFTILKNTELFAIWDDEYIPVGDTFTKITSVSDLDSVSSFLFVFHSGSTVKANGGLEGGDYFKAYDAKIIDDELTYDNDKIVPLSLEKEGSNWLIKSGSSYLTLTANSSNKLAFKEKSKANRWTITFNDGNVKVTSSVEGVNHSIFYNGSGVGRFSNYSSTSMSPVEMWAKSGHAKEVHLSTNELDLNVGFKGIIAVSECIGFEPTTYSWEVTSGSDIVSITNGQGTSEVEVTALLEGEAEVTVTVDGVKAKAVVNVHDYKYNILDKDNYYITTGGAMLGGDLSYITDVDFDPANIWHFEKAYAGDNSYYLIANEKYLSFSEDVYADGKNISEIELTDTPVNVWVVTYSASNGYKIATETKKKGVRSLATHEEQWYAFTGNNYVDLYESGTYDHYAVEALPTTKQYFVGDTLKPLNAHVYAYYTNGFKVEITDRISWETLTAGTKAYGTCTILGEEIDIEMDGLKIYKGDASTFVISGLADTFSIGERINKDNLTVGITYKLSGSEDIIKDKLLNDDYTITPEKIVEGTEKVRIALAKDPTVYYEKEIEIKDNPYVAAAHIHAGDTIILGTLGYTPYEITGGQEVSYDGSKFGYSTFDYMPHGELPLEVGEQGSYFTLKDPVTGYYLKGDNSSLGFNQPDYKSVYAEADGHYEFNLNVTIGGASRLITMKTGLNPDFDDPMVFSSMTYVDGYTDYVVGTSQLDENKFTFEMWSEKNNYEEVYDTAEVTIADWKFEGGAFYYALEISSTLPEECLFTMSYDADYEEWIVSSKPHQDKQLYFNKDGKFGFYTRGSSYTPVMVFRDNDKPLASNPTSVSVSFTPIDGSETGEVMNTVTVGEQFPWTSALIVKVNYAGGASKIIPVGGYTLKQEPDTSVIGTSTGIISYGQNGHQTDKEFTIYVKGKTQAFDVVCPDPIRVGETLQAHLADHYEPPEGEPVTWSVSDPTLASIDQNGNVTGLKAGYVDVIATSFDGTYSDFEHVRIFQNVTDLSLDKTNITMEAGSTETIAATVLPADASNPGVTWDSSNRNVATVNSQGVVIGLSEGTTTITCTTQGKPFGADEPLTATCTVKVEGGTAVRVKGVSLNCEYKEVKRGDTYQLEAIINPSDATDKNVTWTTNNSDLASVSKNGLVQIKASAGIGKTARITVKTNDGGFTAYCDFKITSGGSDPVHVTSVSLNIANKSIDVNESFDLIATVNPSDADNKSVTWSSSNPSVATVDSNGHVAGVSNGQAVITVKTVDGNKTATCTVKVGNVPEPIHVESISLNKDNLELDIGEVYKDLEVTINPENATNKAVTWSSSDTKVVTVKNGVITAVAPGKATITVKSVDGGKTATVQVEVVDKAAQNRENIIIIASVGGGVVVAGVGCGVGIPLAIKAKKRKLLK